MREEEESFNFFFLQCSFAGDEEERYDVVLTNFDAHALVKGNVERNGLVTDCLDDNGCRSSDEMRATIGQERHGIALCSKKELPRKLPVSWLEDRA